ncbi:MAG: hypothetical protein VCG02_15910, partial [Verrucomicrobiota bacterium]
MNEYSLALTKPETHDVQLHDRPVSRRHASSPAGGTAQGPGMMHPLHLTLFTSLVIHATCAA